MKGARHKRYITGQLCSTPHRRLVTARAPPPVAGIHPPAGCAAPFVLSWHLRRWSTSHGPAPTGRPPAPSSLDPRRRPPASSLLPRPPPPGEPGVLPLEARPRWPGSPPPSALKSHRLQVASTPCTPSVRDSVKILHEPVISKISSLPWSSQRPIIDNLGLGIFAMPRKSRRRRNLKTVLTDLPDALIVEILSRLPFKSLCCCKCVDTHWCYLISDPENLKKLPQTLAGFFFDTEDKGRSPKVARHFANVDEGPEIFFEGPEIDPGFSFLPPEFEPIKLEDCCDGLLLCCSSQHPFRRLVCNPATERWVVLPSLPADSSCVAQEDNFHLAFDRDVSSHFHVFQIVLKEWGQVAGIYIYSSGAGSWSFKESGWDSNTSICHRHVFHQGMLHFVSFESTIVSVDVEWKKWRAIPVPEGVKSSELGFLGRSQGHLHYMARIGYHVSIWSLEKYDSDEWTLKYSVSNNNLVNARGTVYGYEYNFISCHPDRSLICYVNCRDNTLMAYDTDREEARVLCSVGRGSLQSCFPYVALFNDSSVPLSS